MSDPLDKYFKTQSLISQANGFKQMYLFRHELQNLLIEIELNNECFLSLT